MGSIVADGNSDYIRRSANIPAYNAATLAGWVKLATGTKAAASNQIICGFGSTNYLAAQIDTSGNLVLRRMGGSLGTAVAAASLNEDVWLYVALTCNADPLQSLYVFDEEGTRIGLSTRSDTNTPTWTAMEVANRYDGGLGLIVGGKFAYWKCWDSALSESELQAEMFSPTVVKTTGFNTGFAADQYDIYKTTDGDGNADRDWTLSGTSTDSDTPPVDSGSSIIKPHGLLLRGCG